jgi:hypothetical protein
MAFDNNGYNTIGGHSRRGTAIQIFTYKTNDTLEQIFTDGYFNPLRHKVKKDDLIFVHREDKDGQNAADLILKITLAPISENITVGNAMSDDWSDDGEKLTPLIDGRDISSGSGSFIASSIDASKIVHTDADKKLVSVDINTAYNKDFKTTIPAPDTDAGNAGDSTDIPKGNHSHPKVDATETIKGQAEIATQPETNAETDDTKIVTPKKLGDFPKFSVLPVGNVEGHTVKSSNSGFYGLETLAGAANSRNWRMATEFNAEGYWELLKSTVEGGTPNTTVLRFDKDGKPAMPDIPSVIRLNKPFLYYDTSTKELKYDPDSYLGLKLVETQNNATDPNNDIDFKVGRMYNHDRTVIINFPTQLTKYGDATFAEGNNQGGLASGVSWGANVFRHKFIIMKADGTADAYFDDNKTADNIPSGFIYYRYIGSEKRDGSGNIRPSQQNGDLITYKDFVVNFNSTIGTASRTLITVDTPPDVKCLTQLFGLVTYTAAVGYLFTEIYQTDVAVNTTNGIMNEDSLTNQNKGNHIIVITDENSQFGLRGTSAATAKLGVLRYKNLGIGAP